MFHLYDSSWVSMVSFTLKSRNGSKYAQTARRFSSNLYHWEASLTLAMLCLGLRVSNTMTKHSPAGERSIHRMRKNATRTSTRFGMCARSVRTEVLKLSAQRSPWRGLGSLRTPYVSEFFCRGPIQSGFNLQRQPV